MVHTFELLKMISKEMFEEIINQLNWTYYKTGFFFSTKYAEQGFSVISLHRFTKNRENNKQQQNTNPDNVFYLYMIKITVNLGAMFGDSGYRSNDILMFKRSFIDVIYCNIYDFLPCLEERREYRQTDIHNYSEYKYRLWKEVNTFTLNRIDFTFDLKHYAKQYMTLINRGYTIRDTRFKKSYYNDDDVSENITVIIDDDGEPDIEYTAELPDDYIADTDYIYYKAKSLNINIYNKAEQLKRKYQTVDNVNDYDFLRFEVQVKKEKLKTLVKKFKLKGRELEYVATPQIEDYVLNEYLKKLTGTGSYMTQEQAFQIIDGSQH